MKLDLNQYKKVKVVSVEKTGVQDVWDVTLLDTEGDDLPHSIVTNGVLTHNSGGSDPQYLGNVLRTLGVKEKIEDVFGAKDRDGKWVVRPRVNYRDDATGETFFNWLNGVERRLPDKKLVSGQWWYIFEDNKTNRAKYGDLIDQKMTRQSGSGLFVPARNGDLQGLVLVDSWAAMNPESMDDDDSNNALAVRARMFSAHLPRVKGRLRSKRIALLGVNQLRSIPMAMYGPKEDEPGGTALKFNCMAGETLLYTKKGLLKAQELAYLGAKELGGIKGVEKLAGFEYKGHSRIVSVETSSGYRVRGKPGHLVLLLKEGSLTPSFQRIGNLRNLRGDTYIAVKRGSDIWAETDVNFDFDPHIEDTSVSKRVLKFPKRMTPKLAYFLGLQTGDGHTREGHPCNLAASNQELRRKWLSLVKELFGIQGTESPAGCHFYSQAVVEFLTYIGQGNKSSWQKEVPWSVRMSTRESQVAFLAGLFDADGSCSGSAGSFFSVSTNLLRQVQAIALNLGAVTGRSNLRESWFRHGSSSKKSKKAYGEGAAGIMFYGSNWTLLATELLAWSTHSLKKEAMKKYIERTLGRSQESKVNVLPLIKCYGKDSSKIVELVRKLTRRSTISLSIKEKYSEIEAEVASLRTSHEREKARRQLTALKNLIRSTEEHNLVWCKIDRVSWSNEVEATFDGNMPATSTIITNGIVSHNSDARLRLTGRSLSGAPFHPKGEGQIERERSFSVEKGQDVYRYIHVRNIKNKLSLPMRETWLRLWIEDGEGHPRGFDPVFDTWYYLHQTGQIAGKRTTLKLTLSGRDTSKSFPSAVLKALVLGDKDTIRSECKAIGIQPVKLRDGCFNQLHSGLAEELYLKAKNEAARDKDEED